MSICDEIYASTESELIFEGERKKQLAAEIIDYILADGGDATELLEAERIRVVKRRSSDLGAIHGRAFGCDWYFELPRRVSR